MYMSPWDVRLADTLRVVEGDEGGVSRAYLAMAVAAVV
jgi:hypothetical protein